jgi:hypothetical protein
MHLRVECGVALAESQRQSDPFERGERGDAPPLGLTRGVGD